MEKQYCKHCKYEIEREPVEEHYCSEACYFEFMKTAVGGPMGSMSIRQVSVPLTVALPSLGGVMDMTRRSRKWS